MFVVFQTCESPADVPPWNPPMATYAMFAFVGSITMRAT